VGCHPLHEVPSLRRRRSTATLLRRRLLLTAAVRTGALVATAAGACLLLGADSAAVRQVAGVDAARLITEGSALAGRAARADVIFDGVALDGPTFSGFERFRVIRYQKGTGPRLVRLITGRKRHRDGGGVVTSVSIDARRCEMWSIYARRLRPGVFETTVCDGSQ
jgi:hypothetical protein